MIRRPSTSLSGAPRGRVPIRGPQPKRTNSPSWSARLAWGLGFVVIGSLLIWALWPVLSILIAAAALAYLLDPLVDRLEARGLSRGVGIGLLAVAGLLLTVVLSLLIVPPVIGKSGEIASRLTEFFATLDQRIRPLAQWIETNTGYAIPLDVSALQQQAPELIREGLPKAQEMGTAFITGLFTQGMSILGAILNLTLLPLFTAYLLADWDKLIAKVADLIPWRFRPRVTRIAVEVDKRLSAFVRGQTMLCLILGVLYSIGLWIAGIDLPFTVGMLAGALFIVPYLGTIVGVILALGLSLLEYGVDLHLLWVILVFSGVQLLEGYVLTPQIVGNEVGLHPLVVMICLVVGGSLLGIWGMLLAIPITATLSVLGAEWLDLYRRSRVYGESPQ